MIDYEYALRCLPELGRGLLITILATVAGMTFALLYGLVWTALGMSRFAWIRGVGRGGVELIRSTPLLVQLYLWFYVMPKLGVRLPPLVTGILGLGLHYSAYLAEVYRAGIGAVATGQWEAAQVLGMSKARTFVSVILPQAIPPMVPAIGNYLVAMFKDTPVLSAITVVELMQRAKLIGADEFRYLEPFTLVGIMFLLLSVIATTGIQRLESHT